MSSSEFLVYDFAHVVTLYHCIYMLVSMLANGSAYLVVLKCLFANRYFFPPTSYFSAYNGVSAVN